MDSFNCDFHIHSKYSGGTSKKQEIPQIALGATQKGLDLIATGDALHNDWIKHLKNHLTVQDGVWRDRQTHKAFLLQTEVEDIKRVHHVILLPDFDSIERLRQKWRGKSPNLDKDGRPNIRLAGEQLAEDVQDAGGLIGPSHAFTPWTSLYKEYDSIKDCYGSQTKNIMFLELGLSADTNMAQQISELDGMIFLSNSDCHSPQPHRLGREFNRCNLKKPTFSEVKKAFQNKQGREITLNVGLNPLEGKYHLTACTRCFKPFRWGDAQTIKRRCPICNGLIKKGVRDRVKELADEKQQKNSRPPYLHILPLAQVIGLALGVRTLTAKKIQETNQKLMEEFDSEINILVDEDPENIEKIHPKVGHIIKRFRQNRIYYVPGGGGRYGQPQMKPHKLEYFGQGQKKIGEY